MTEEQLFQVVKGDRSAARTPHLIEARKMPLAEAKAVVARRNQDIDPSEGAEWGIFIEARNGPV